LTLDQLLQLLGELAPRLGAAAARVVRIQVERVLRQDAEECAIAAVAPQVQHGHRIGAAGAGPASRKRSPPSRFGAFRHHAWRTYATESGSVVHLLASAKK